MNIAERSSPQGMESKVKVTVSIIALSSTADNVIRCAINAALESVTV
jgi:hypothetical protein